jgi:SNF2 family DNA or RNA helicase
LEETGISFMAMKGGMSLKQKQKSVEKFQSDDSVGVFVICLKNFSGSPVLSAAQQIVFMEPISDDPVKKRAIGTVVRIGNAKKVKVVTLLTSDTIDDTVYGDIFSLNV